MLVNLPTPEALKFNGKNFHARSRFVKTTIVGYSLGDHLQEENLGMQSPRFKTWHGDEGSRHGSYLTDQYYDS